LVAEEQVAFESFATKAQLGNCARATFRQNAALAGLNSYCMWACICAKGMKYSILGANPLAATPHELYLQLPSSGLCLMIFINL
jgi:hypothetical protein